MKNDNESPNNRHKGNHCKQLHHQIGGRIAALLERCLPTLVSSLVSVASHNGQKHAKRHSRSYRKSEDLPNLLNDRGTRTRYGALTNIWVDSRLMGFHFATVVGLNLSSGESHRYTQAWSCHGPF
jgi:hypothetical protein